MRLFYVRKRNWSRREGKMVRQTFSDDVEELFSKVEHLIDPVRLEKSRGSYLLSRYKNRLWEINNKERFLAHRRRYNRRFRANLLEKKILLNQKISRGMSLFD